MSWGLHPPILKFSFQNPISCNIKRHRTLCSNSTGGSDLGGYVRGVYVRQFHSATPLKMGLGLSFIIPSIILCTSRLMYQNVTHPMVFPLPHKLAFSICLSSFTFLSTSSLVTQSVFSMSTSFKRFTVVTRIYIDLL